MEQTQGKEKKKDLLKKLKMFKWDYYKNKI